jgi:hypothetical protein
MTMFAEPGVYHARVGRWHWHVLGPWIGAQDHTVVAQVERPHAVGAHIADGAPWPLSAKAAVSSDMVWRRQLTPPDITFASHRFDRMRVSIVQPVQPLLVETHSSGGHQTCL